MSEFNDLVERHIAVWNEVEPDRRQRLIAETFGEGASYVDPLMASEGHAAINGMSQAVQEHFPAAVSAAPARSMDITTASASAGSWPRREPGGRQGQRLRYGRECAQTTVIGFIDQAPA